MEQGVRVLNGAVLVCVGQDRSGYYFTWGERDKGERIRLCVPRTGKGQEYRLNGKLLSATFSDQPEKPR